MNHGLRGRISYVRKAGAVLVQRLALFDLDNTLVDRERAFVMWANEFTADRKLGDAGLDWLLTIDGRISGRRGPFFAAVRERFTLAESVETLWAGYRSRMPELVICQPNVLQGLARLRESGWSLGIVTNGVADNQLAKIERTRLGEHVDACCVSGDMGVGKPDVRIFQLAAERCGMTLPKGGWMVGDDPAHDIAEGRAAGLRTIWIGLPEQWPMGEPNADRTVPDAAAAIDLLLDESTRG